MAADESRESVEGTSLYHAQVSVSLATMVDSIPNAAFVVDSEGRVTHANSLAKQTLQHPENDNFEGLPLSTFVTVDEGSVEDLIIRSAEDGGSIEVNSNFRNAKLKIATRLIKDNGLDPLALCFPEILAPPVNRERIVHSISSQLISIKPLEEVLGEVTRLLVEVAQADHVTVTLLDSAQLHFVFEAEYPPLTNAQLGQAIPVKGMPTQQSLLENKQPLVIRDVLAHAIYQESPDVAALVKRIGIKSQAIIPLVYKDRVIGTIGVDSLDGHAAFCKEDISMYQTIAGQVAIAIENARLLQSDETLRSIFREAVGGKSIQVAAPTLLNDFFVKTAAIAGSIELVVGGNRTVLHEVNTKTKPHVDTVNDLVEHNDFVRSAIEKSEIAVVSQPLNLADHATTQSTASGMSRMCIPLDCGEGIKAAVVLKHEERGHFERVLEGQRSDLLALAATASKKLRHAYSLDASSSHVRAISLLGGVAELVGTKLGTCDLLKSLAKQIAHELGADFCCVFLRTAKDGRLYLKPRGYWPDAEDTKPPCMEFSGDQRNNSIFRCFSNPEVGLAPSDTQSDFELVPWDSKSLMVQSVVSGGYCYGVIAVGAIKEKAFRQSDQLLLATVARLAANAIEREAGLDRLHTISNTLAKNDDLQDVLNQILTAARDVTHKDDGVIFLLDSQTKQITQRIDLPGFAHPAPRIGHVRSISARLLNPNHDGVVEIPDLRLDADVQAEVKNCFASLVGARLTMDGQPVGLLFLNGKKGRGLTSNERTFFTKLVEQASIAIERISLTTQLRNAEAMYHSLIDNVPVCVFRKDKHSVFVSANKGFSDSLGEEMPDIIGKTDFNFYPSPDAEKYVADDRRVLNGETLTKDEEHVTPKDGKRIWVRIYKTPVLDGDGQIIGTQGMFWDVTDEKNSAEQAKAIAERYEVLVEQLPIGITVVDGSNIILANPAAANLFGWGDTASMKGLNLAHVLNVSGVVKSEEVLQQSQTRGQVETTLKSGQKQEVRVDIHTRPIPGGPDNYQIVFHDITQHNERLKDISHQVKNSLTAAASLLALQRNETSDKSVKVALQDAIDRIEAMAQIHEELLKGQDASFQTSDLAIVISGIVEKMVKRSGEDIAVHCDLSPIRLSLDIANACASIVLELITNVLKHAFPKSGPESIPMPWRLELSLAREGDLVKMRIYDNGCGLGSSAPSIGLSIVKNYVEKRLQGSLVTESKSGSGTLHCIQFPDKGSRSI